MTARKIDMMHLQFGTCADPEKTCKTCNHLVCHQANRKYYKCEAYGDTRSEASDWKVRNRACGLYNKPYKGNKVITLIIPSRNTETTIKGQMTMPWEVLSCRE